MTPIERLRRDVKAFVAAHGRAFTPDRRTYSGPRMTISECFMNSQIIVQRPRSNPTRFVYVEGFAGPLGEPLHHAWVMRRDGSIIDPTWRPEPGAPPLLYFGVPFSIAYLARIGLSLQTSSLLLRNLEILCSRVTDFAATKKG